ncbi:MULTISPECIES: sec-independent translocase [Aestuariimicrobium]|uniref:sec-independent translocase n=1 Tax=Aestuariimicrobium TaxID=396388 RepID=UPI0003B71DB4|nr:MULTISPECIES: sec-independent translocase [Aestuariimicrobium]CAI9400098.1 Sec-independent protein translocase protein TatB [Aestuariimicrobium sp. T2.26MG-19.2B]
MLDIGAPEFILLVVLAIVMFGPERIPDMARKAAKVVHFLRNIANGATAQLKAELGPEYADLTPADLNPKTFIQKHLLDQIQDEVDYIKKDVESIKEDLKDDADELKAITSEVESAVRSDGSSSSGELALASVAPYDSEAT